MYKVKWQPVRSQLHDVFQLDRDLHFEARFRSSEFVR